MLVVTQDVAIVCRSRTNNNSETKAAAIAPLAEAAAAAAAGAPESEQKERERERESSARESVREFVCAPRGVRERKQNNEANEAAAARCDVTFGHSALVVVICKARSEERARKQAKRKKIIKELTKRVVKRFSKRVVECSGVESVTTATTTTASPRLSV